METENDSETTGWRFLLWMTDDAFVLIWLHLVSDGDVRAPPSVLSLVHHSVLTAGLIGDGHSFRKLTVLKDHL